jgi:KaiC/GvpD/RAD55 family RecA-like ATPase
MAEPFVCSPYVIDETMWACASERVKRDLSQRATSEYTFHVFDYDDDTWTSWTNVMDAVRGFVNEDVADTIDDNMNYVCFRDTPHSSEYFEFRETDEGCFIKPTSPVAIIIAGTRDAIPIAQDVIIGVELDWEKDCLLECR